MSKQLTKRHGKNYAIRVCAWALYAGFNGIEPIVIGYLSFYLTNNLFLSAAVVGALIAVAKVFDGFSDVAAGFLIDRTKSRFGKGRPYTLFVIAMWSGIVLLFSTPISWSNTAKYVYIFGMYLLTDTVFRTLVLASEPVHYRYGFSRDEQIDSIGIWGVCGGVISIAGTIVIPSLIDSYQTQPHGWTIVMLIIAIPAMLLSLLRFFCIPENDVSCKTVQEPTMQCSMKEAVKCIFHNKSLLFFGLALLLVTAMNSMSAIYAYYFTYIIGDLSQLSVASSFAMVSLLAMPVYPILAKKYGKRNVALVLCIAGGIVSLFAIFMYKNVIALGIIFALRNICFTSINVMMSMFTIDAMKYTEWKDSVKIDGLIGSIQSVVQKIGAAIMLFVSGTVLQAFGFDGSLAVQSASATKAIWAMCILLPIALMFFAAFAISGYKLDKQMPQIEKELELRNKK